MSREGRSQPIQPVVQHGFLGNIPPNGTLPGKTVVCENDDRRRKTLTLQPISINGVFSMFAVAVVTPPPPTVVSTIVRPQVLPPIVLVGPNLPVGTVKTITATDNLTFSVTTALVKTAVLSPSDTITFTETGVLVKTAKVSSSDTITFAEAVTLVKTAVVSPLATIRFAETVTVVATKILSFAPTIRFTEVANVVRVSASTPTRMARGMLVTLLRMMERLR